jgi:hypothetical protein
MECLKPIVPELEGLEEEIWRRVEVEGKVILVCWPGDQNAEGRKESADGSGSFLYNNIIYMQLYMDPLSKDTRRTLKN